MGAMATTTRTRAVKIDQIAGDAVDLAREAAEAIRRARKVERKRLEREGF